MGKDYLAHTIGTGSVFTCLFLLTLWVISPDSTYKFIMFISASGDYQGGNYNLILAFGAVQPVIGLFIDVLLLPFANRFQYNNKARRLVQVLCRVERNNYEDALKYVKQQVPQGERFDETYVDYLSKERLTLPDDLSHFKRICRVFQQIKNHSLPIDPDIDLIVRRYQDEKTKQLEEWEHRQMTHVYMAENWIAGTIMGFLGGLGVAVYLEYGSFWQYVRLQADFLCVLTVLTTAWIFVLLAGRSAILKRENDMILLWVLEKIATDMEKGSLKI